MKDIENNQVSEVSLTYNTKIKNSDRKKVTNSKSTEEIFRAIRHYNDNIPMFECFYAMYLNRANKVLSIMLISEGGTSGTVTDIKKIIAPAILQNASSVIISHNHPSGNLQPSSADTAITDKIKNALKLFDITLLDHIILSDESYFSMADENIL
jgi:DNA repair protein RadC